MCIYINIDRYAWTYALNPQSFTCLAQALYSKVISCTHTRVLTDVVYGCQKNRREKGWYRLLQHSSLAPTQSCSLSLSLSLSFLFWFSVSVSVYFLSATHGLCYTSITIVLYFYNFTHVLYFYNYTHVLYLYNYTHLLREELFHTRIAHEFGALHCIPLRPVTHHCRQWLYPRTINAPHIY